MTSKEAVNFVRLLSDVFFLVRISDPDTNKVFDLNENDEFIPTTTCYQVWGRSTPCIHCYEPPFCERHRWGYETHEPFRFLKLVCYNLAVGFSTLQNPRR